MPNEMTDNEQNYVTIKIPQARTILTFPWKWDILSNFTPLFPLQLEINSLKFRTVNCLETQNKLFILLSCMFLE